MTKMTKITNFIFFNIILIYLSINASAIDNNIMNNEKIDFKKKIYLKGEYGHSIINNKDYLENDDPLIEHSLTMKGSTFGIGIGYIINSNLRSDLMVNYSSNKNYSDPNKERTDFIFISQGYIKDFYTKHDVIKATINLSYDFHNSTNIIPYITAGIGMQNIKQSLILQTSSKDSGDGIVKNLKYYEINQNYNKEISIKSITSSSISSKRTNAFAYQVGAGIGYKITPNIILDVAYKLENIAEPNYINPFIISISETALISATRIDQKEYLTLKSYLKQSVVAGIRIQF